MIFLLRMIFHMRLTSWCSQPIKILRMVTNRNRPRSMNVPNNLLAKSSYFFTPVRSSNRLTAGQNLDWLRSKQSLGATKHLNGLIKLQNRPILMNDPSKIFQDNFVY